MVKNTERTVIVIRTVEVGQGVNQMKVLEQQRSHGAGALPPLGVVNGSTIGGGVDWLFIVSEGGSRGVVGDHCGGGWLSGTKYWEMTLVAVIEWTTGSTIGRNERQPTL